LSNILLINITCFLFWGISYVLGWLKKERTSNLFFMFPIIILCVEIVYLWFFLDRPPMRTLGETRLWYSFLLPSFGFLIYLKLKKRWILTYTSLMAILFIALNMAHPENFDKTLAPALQSPWFIPHVIVYMIAYALLGATSLYSFQHILADKFSLLKRSLTRIDAIDNFVYSGFAFLTLGLIFGALWAKEAWGDYWTWDPKETWALITWFFYLNYIHLNRKQSPKLSAYFLAFGFIVLLICWFGVNYMPSAGNSVHTYTS